MIYFVILTCIDVKNTPISIFVIIIVPLSLNSSVWNYDEAISNFGQSSSYQAIIRWLQGKSFWCSKDQCRENIISPPLLKNYCIIDPNSICVCKKWTKSRLFRYCSSQKLQLMNGVFGNPRGWWGVSLASIHHSFPPHIFYAGIWTFPLQIFYFQWLLLMMYLHQRKIY